MQQGVPGLDLELDILPWLGFLQVTHYSLPALVHSLLFVCFNAHHFLVKPALEMIFNTSAFHKPCEVFPFVQTEEKVN